MLVRSIAALASTLALLIASPGALAGVPTAPPVAPPLAYSAQPPTAGALYSDGQTGRYLLGGTWLYRADPLFTGIADGWWRDLAPTDGWSSVTVPNSYNAGDFSDASMSGSIGWYRRDFVLPSGAFARYVSPADRHWIIRFESVNYRATVWLNGRRLGTHAGAYEPFELDLKGLRPGVNRLIVRVDDRHAPTDLPPGPGALWWNFGGIQREVYLRAVQRADLAQVQVRPLLPCRTCAAMIDEQVIVRNVTGASQQVRLRGSYGGRRLDFGSAVIAPHAIWTATANVAIPHPSLWAPGHPSLYSARLSLSDGQGRPLGGYFTYSGIRSVTVSKSGQLLLNGRQVHLRGVALHEQNVITGAALSPVQLQQLVGWVRALGADIIRTHYPLNPEIEEMADRYGILIWSEVPVYRLSKTNLAQPGVIAHADEILRTNILTNQNHPSILLWSIGNELPTQVDSIQASYIAGATSLVHKLDPTRPVGLAVAMWPGVPCQRAYAPLNVIGVNEYFGWFDENNGATADRDTLGPFLDGVRACYPRQAIMVTEFGFDANQDGPVEVRGTYAFQINSASYHLGVFATKRWLAGAIWWLLQDFASAPGWSGGNPSEPDPPWVEKGLVDRYGNLKPAFATIASIYHGTSQLAPATQDAP